MARGRKALPGKEQMARGAHLWPHWEYVQPMLQMLRLLELDDSTAGRRRFRLFGIACCRRVEDLLNAEQRDALATLERRVMDRLEGSKRAKEPGMPFDPLVGGGRYLAQNALHLAADTRGKASRVAERVAEACRTARSLAPGQSIPAGSLTEARLLQQEEKAQCDLLRDLFGNPYAPLPTRAFPPHVIQLARDCASGKPELFGVLADALDDLEEAEAAAHCRAGGHVRGCHVLEWVLG